jgi:hypothetical protein
MVKIARGRTAWTAGASAAGIDTGFAVANVLSGAAGVFRETAAFVSGLAPELAESRTLDVGRNCVAVSIN